MFLKKYKSIINSLRNRTLLKLNNYFKFKRLTVRLKKKNGKNFLGRIVNKRMGGGYFYRYRKIDNLHYKIKNEYLLLGCDYSRYNTGLLGLLSTQTNIKKYFLLPENFNKQKYFKTTFFFQNFKNSIGHTIPLGWIPANTLIYNIETKPFNGSKLVRAGGTYAKIINHTTNYVKILLPSKKIIYLSKYCLASIGRVSNILHKFQIFSKAGIKRNLNIRPRVKGEAMNAVDHPNGGKTRGGKPTKNYWGFIIK